MRYEYISLSLHKIFFRIMKATLYKEEIQQCEPADEKKLAIADTKPAKVDAPRQSYYIVDYKTQVKPTVIAALIFVVFIVALLVF